MKSTAKLKQKALIIGGAVLIIMAVSLLFLIRRPASIPAPSPRPRHHGAAPAASEDPGRSRAASAGRPSGRHYRSASTPSVAAPAARPDAAPRASNAGLTPRVASKQIPGRVLADAPPVIPSEIQKERDPARKAQLMKMHKLAMARVKVSQLRRRQRLLRSTLSRASQDGSLSPQRLKRAQQDLRDLDTGIVDAKRALEQAQAAAGE